MNRRDDGLREQILERALDVYSVIMGRRPESQKGNTWVWRSPWREDKNPSFTVYIDNGRWVDFGEPDANGDVLDFIARMNHLDAKTQFPQVLEKGAAILGLATSSIPGNATPPLKTTTKAPIQTNSKKAAVEVIMPVPVTATAPLEALKGLGKPDHVYSYKDAKGRPLYYVYRWDAKDGHGKEFRPLSWTANGWEWTAPPSPRPLYGLDLLATNPTLPVIVCEGEKACLAAHTALAETHVVLAWSNGAEGVCNADWTPLEGRDVTIWPDNDKPGTNAAAKIKKLLPGTVILDVSDLGKNADAADVTPDEVRQRVKEGRTVEAVKETVLAGEVPEKFKLVPTSAARILCEEYPPVEWIAEGFLPTGTTVLTAAPKAGKTTFVWQLVCDVVDGKPFLDYYPCAKREVLMIDKESGEIRLQRLLSRLGGCENMDALHILTVGRESHNLPGTWRLDAEGFALLDELLDAHPEITFIVLDTLERLLPPSKSKGDAYAIGVDRIAPLQNWALQRKISVLAIHHNRKGTGKDSQGLERMDAASGSYGVLATFEHIYVFTKHEGDVYRLSVESRDADINELALQRLNNRWERLGLFEEVVMTDQRAKLIEFLKSHPGSGPKVIGEALDQNSAAVYEALKRARNCTPPLIERTEHGKYYVIHPPAHPPIDLVGFRDTNKQIKSINGGVSTRARERTDTSEQTQPLELVSAMAVNHGK